MEWIPKTLDNLDSAAIGLYQALVGYYRWVLLRLMLTVAAVTAITLSPTIRLSVIAAVVTYLFMTAFGRLVAGRRLSRITRTQS
jgi:hypothetical protein